MEAILETKKLSHIYSAGTPFERGALLDVDFTAYQGEYLGIIGHTGSGKSTLIQHLNGLLKPTSGQVLFQGTDIWSDPKTTRQTRFQVGLVFQYPEYQLFEETVYQDISFGPKNMGLDEAEVDRRVREAARFVGLRDEQLEKSPFELSGGQKRRVAIAGVIAMEPKVLILDEPTAGLDPVGVESILGNIRDYHQAHKLGGLPYPAIDLPRVQPHIPGAEGDVLVYRLLKQLVLRVLEHQPHLEADVPDLLRLRPDVLPMEQDLPRRRPQQAVQMLNQGGFAGAGVADDP